jgi:hypothetical protein
LRPSVPATGTIRRRRFGVGCDGHVGRSLAVAWGINLDEARCATREQCRPAPLSVRVGGQASAVHRCGAAGGNGERRFVYPCFDRSGWDRSPMARRSESCPIRAAVPPDPAPSATMA